MKARSSKPNVLLLFGWSDPDGFAAVSETARQLGWHLELRTYFTDTIPDQWHGDGIGSHRHRSHRGLGTGADGWLFARRPLPKEGRFL